MVSDKRKASDIILELEEKTRLLTRLVSNMDNNSKLILDRLNHIGSRVDKLYERVFQNSAPPQPGPQQRVSATQPEIMVAQPISNTAVDYDEYGHPELTEEVLPKGQRRNVRTTKEQSRGKVPVSQQIMTPDGKAIFLANVEILKSKENPKRGEPAETLIKQTRTNAKGRWIAALEPGNYIVHVMKRMSADGSKLPVELRYSVSIPESDSPLELPIPELPDIYKEN